MHGEVHPFDDRVVAARGDRAGPPMIEMTLAEIAEAVGGVAHGEATVTGGAFVDTRTPEPGGLFVAIEGERVDGHDFAGTAVAAGAVAVLGSRPTEAPTVVVDDVVPRSVCWPATSCDRLADTTVRTPSPARQGKTGTKDYLAHVLEARRADRRDPRQLQQRDRRAADGAPRDRGDPAPRRGDGRARHRPRRLPLHASRRPTSPPSSTSAPPTSASSAAARRSRRPRARSSRRCPPQGTAVLNADDPLVAAMAARTVAQRA